MTKRTESPANYPRDLRGHGRHPPLANWPGNARVALQFVLNYEEGGENNILHGDAASEAFLSEIVGAQAWAGQRWRRSPTTTSTSWLCSATGRP